MNTLSSSREILSDLATITHKATEISQTLARSRLTSAGSTTKTESGADSTDKSISLSIDARIPSLSVGTAEQLLTPREHKLLTLYDQLEDLRLAIRIIEEIPNVLKQTHTENEDESTPSIMYTENPRLVDAAAEATLAAELQDKVRILEHRVKLKRAIAEDVVMSLPVRDAVYGTAEAAKEGAEFGLNGRMAMILPLLTLRDDLESQVLKLSAELNSNNNENADGLDMHAQAIKAHTRNRATLSTLDAELSSQYDRILARLTPADRAELAALLSDLRTSRTKVAILADLIPMLVTGSGIDWANDERLGEILLECGQIGLGLNEEVELDDVIFAT